MPTPHPISLPIKLKLIELVIGRKNVQDMTVLIPYILVILIENKLLYCSFLRNYGYFMEFLGFGVVDCHPWGLILET